MFGDLQLTNGHSSWRNSNDTWWWRCTYGKLSIITKQ